MRSSQPVRAAGRPVCQLGSPQQGQVGKSWSARRVWMSPVSHSCPHQAALFGAYLCNWWARGCHNATKSALALFSPLA